MPADAAVQTSIKCPVCENQTISVFFPAFYHFEKVAYDLVKCKECQLIRVNPMPGDEVVERMYSDQYFKSDFISGRYEGSYEDILRKRRPEINEILQTLERSIPENKRSLFEVGAAGGAFLKCAKDRKWNVSGLEISSWGTRHSNEVYGVSVRQGNFQLTQLEDRAFPVMFFGDVFEHFTDPVHAIKKVNRSLTPEGYVVMLLPMYISSWTFPFFMSLRGFMKNFNLPKSFKVLLKFEADQEFNPPYHVYEYSRKSIAGLLKRHGFEMLMIKGNLPVPESLSSAKPNERFGAKSLRLITLGIYKILKFFSENFNFPLVRSLVIAKKVNEV